MGTNGAIKAVSSEQARDAGVQLMFANTYHLMVHPDADCVKAAGGLHKFMGREAQITTDSGGFQVFSLGDQSDKHDQPELKALSPQSTSEQTCQKIAQVCDWREVPCFDLTVTDP